MRKASNADSSLRKETNPTKHTSAWPGGLVSSAPETGAPLTPTVLVVHADNPSMIGTHLNSIRSTEATELLQKKRGSLSLWLWVAAGYIFMCILWTVMFKVAGSANVQSVPLVTRGTKP